MMEILKRENEIQEGQDGEDEELDLTVGLDQLDLNTLNLEDLTPAQRRDFERAVVDGRLGNAIQAWVPWWEARDVVQEGMVLPDDIPSVASLTQGPVHPALGAHAADVLFAYVYTLRRHNGEQDDVTSVVDMSLQLSGVLGAGDRPESVRVALLGCLERARDPGLFNSTDFSLGVLHDMSKICTDGALLVRALAELHTQHATALPLSPKPRNTRRAILKKLWFFLAWAKECNKEAATEIKAGVTKELSKQEEAFKGGEIRMGAQMSVPPRKMNTTSF